MLKSIQIKIVLIFSIVGIVMITAFGLTEIYNLQEMQKIVLSSSEQVEINENISKQIYNTIIFQGCFNILFDFYTILC